MPEARTSDGARIHYEVEGREEGPPLVFSNSLGTNLHMWDGQAEAATGLGFRVIRYDQRGHGRSDAPSGEYTLQRLGEDVLELLDALKIERTAFCGLSMGGMTGIWLALNHPRRFARMAQCNTAVWMPPRDLWETRIRSVGEGGMESVVDGVVERWFTPGFREENPGEVSRVRAMILTTNPAGYAGCCAAIRDMDMRDFLGTIEAPTLVVIGAHDPATPPERGQYIVERIPGAQKATLDTAHLSNVERRDDFNRVVLGFLAGGAK
ncbi:MAG: 3-oxoadipate enol-lactonase [Propylenella sp.]